MKDTQRIDEEIQSLKKRIERLNKLKLESCITCKDSKCAHSGTNEDAVCQSHTVYGVD